MSQAEYREFAVKVLSANNKSKQQIALAETNSANRMNEYLKAAEEVICKNSSEKILVAVARKSLQSAVPHESNKVRFAILKERFSYVCLRKFYNCISNAETHLNTEDRINFFSLITWQSQTKDGDLNEVLHYSRTPVLWKKVACEAVSCYGDKCEHYSKCYFHSAKKAAENSNLLLVSHKLFLQDLQMDFAILPVYEKIILDNAGKLPLESQKIFGRHLNFYAFRNMIKQNSWCKKWEAEATECEKLFLSLIKEMVTFAQKAKKRKLVYSQNLASETGISPESLQSTLKKLLEIIEQATIEQTDNAKDCMQFASDIRKFSADVAFLFAASHNDFVYWVDCPANPYQVTFNAEPLNPSAKWNRAFYPILKSAFFTSDIMSINESFDYLVNRLGLYNRNPRCHSFASNDTVHAPEVLIADFIPKPTDEKYTDELIKTINDIIFKNKSKTLVFCDNGMIQKLQASPRPERPCFFQGIDGSFYNLTGFFQKEENSVLVGTQDELKNLEDMDLPENSLIVVARLPFPDIKEPVTARRMDILKEQGKNAFNIITMPETLLTMRNLYSIILRSGKKQTLLLLDSRIISEIYGAKVQKLFPEFKTLSHRVFSTGFFSV